MGIWLALVLTASPAARHEAEQLYKSARKDFASEAFKMAFTEASRAYELVPKPMYLLEIADCQKALHRWGDAAATYRSYLGMPQVKGRAAVKKSLAEVQRHLGGQSSGGGELALAPLTSGPAPADPLAVSPLVAAPLAPPPPPVRPAPLVIASEGGAQPSPFSADAPPAATAGDVSSSDSGGHSRVLAYTLLGVSLAAAGFAVAGWVDVAGFNSYVSSVQSGQLVSSGQTARANQSSAQTWQAVAIATTIAAGLAAAGVALTW